MLLQRRLSMVKIHLPEIPFLTAIFARDVSELIDILFTALSSRVIFNLLATLVFLVVIDVVLVPTIAAPSSTLRKLVF
jgi:hypothetical protein